MRAPSTSNPMMSPTRQMSAAYNLPPGSKQMLVMVVYVMLCPGEHMLMLVRCKDQRCGVGASGRG